MSSKHENICYTLSHTLQEYPAQIKRTIRDMPQGVPEEGIEEDLASPPPSYSLSNKDSEENHHINTNEKGTETCQRQKDCY